MLCHNLWVGPRAADDEAAPRRRGLVAPIVLSTTLFLQRSGARMHIDDAVKAFLAHKRIAVAGVSRAGQSPANAIAKRLRAAGYAVFAVNPSGDVIDGHPSFRTLQAIDGGVEAVVVVTKPADALPLALDAARAGATWIWFHQGLGPISFDDAVLDAARGAGLKVIAAGCPMMYVEPDVFHACARGVFRLVGRIPADVDVDAAAAAAAG